MTGLELGLLAIIVGSIFGAAKEINEQCSCGGSSGNSKSKDSDLDREIRELEREIDDLEKY